MLRANVPFVGLAVIYFLGAATVGRVFGFSLDPEKYPSMLWSASFFLCMTVLIGSAVLRLVKNNPQSPIRFLLEQARERTG